MTVEKHSRHAITTIVMVLVAVVAITVGATPGAATVRSAASGSGIGTPAALSAPNCDPATKRLKMAFAAAPPCVRPWKDGEDNGGRTAQGVTADSVKVVVTYVDKYTSPTKNNVVNQATGTEGSERATVMDNVAMLDALIETWGRKIDVELVKASGADEASQRADAVKVAAMKPFAVVDFAYIYGGGGGPVFRAALQGKVPVVNALTPVALNNPIVRNAAEWSGKALVGHKAKWAGDEAMHDKERVFGVIYPEGSAGMDYDLFAKLFAQQGGKVAVAVGYDPGSDAAQAGARVAEQAPTLIGKLKSAGVTTVLNFADGVTATPPVMRAATAQDYNPEWVVTGLGYQDIDVVGRLSDQKQMAHAFGVIWFAPYGAEVKEPYHTLFQWYWGTDKGTESIGALSSLIVLYYGIHLAGPNLTFDTYRKGLASFPPIGGAYSNQVSTLESSYKATKGEPPPRGGALGWWSPTTSASSQISQTVGNGAYLYLDGGKRYIAGKFPKGEPKFFEESDDTIAVIDGVPKGEEPPSYPCEGCPSSGGAQVPSSL